MENKLLNNYTLNFINLLMLKGKKSISRKIILNVFKLLKEGKYNPYKILTMALYAIKPIIETKKRRRGRIFYDIPFPIRRKKRQWFLSTKWLIQSTRAVTSRSIQTSFLDEILKASKYQGLSVKKKLQIYTLAQKNRPFLHFRWS